MNAWQDTPIDRFCETVDGWGIARTRKRLWKATTKKPSPNSHHFFFSRAEANKSENVLAGFTHPSERGVGYCTTIRGPPAFCAGKWSEAAVKGARTDGQSRATFSGRPFGRIAAPTPRVMKSLAQERCRPSRRGPDFSACLLLLDGGSIAWLLRALSLKG